MMRRMNVRNVMRVTRDGITPIHQCSKRNRRHAHRKTLSLCDHKQLLSQLLSQLLNQLLSQLGHMQTPTFWIPFASAI